DLLFGGRAETTRNRPGAGRATIEGRGLIPAGGAVARRAGAAGAAKAPAGAAGPGSVLGDLGEDLIAMHGQSAQQRLLQPARQRSSLDRYAGDAVSRPLAEYRAAYQEYRDVGARPQELP